MNSGSLDRADSTGWSPSQGGGRKAQLAPFQRGQRWGASPRQPGDSSEPPQNLRAALDAMHFCLSTCPPYRQVPEEQTWSCGKGSSSGQLVARGWSQVASSGGGGAPGRGGPEWGHRVRPIPAGPLGQGLPLLSLSSSICKVGIMASGLWRCRDRKYSRGIGTAAALIITAVAINSRGRVSRRPSHIPGSCRSPGFLISPALGRELF